MVEAWVRERGAGPAHRPLETLAPTLVLPSAFSALSSVGLGTFVLVNCGDMACLPVGPQSQVSLCPGCPFPLAFPGFQE